MSVRETVKKIAGSPFPMFPLVILLVRRRYRLRAVSSCGLNLQTNHDLANGDIAVDCFGAHAIESLDVQVHVATNFSKMMKWKKIARNKSSNFDSTIQSSVAILRRMVFALLSHSSEYWNCVFLALLEHL